MNRIKKVSFINHPILKNLVLDFTGPDGKAVDTVIIAGENGNCKSIILNLLYGVASGAIDCEADIVLENSSSDNILLSYRIQDTYIIVDDHDGLKCLPGYDAFIDKYHFSGIYSDVDITFNSKNIQTVTSLTLDSSSESRRSQSDMPRQIKQLLIDVQALDDAALSEAMRKNPDKTKRELNVEERMPRFTRAFSRMFSDLSYERIDNVNNHKEIIFSKNGIEIPIDDLSSGEKQVVYRGCFLLKDVNAINGAFVFIDEPEISLHPTWQKKIMDYYKGMFVDSNGIQTSQIFAVTHSPFVIHNESRLNDKVIVIARNAQGGVMVKDRPEYYKCNSIEVIQDAFAITDFQSEQSTVYLEGRTDERYFKRAIEVFGFSDTLPFQFKWIGYIDNNGQEVNTGCKSLDAAYKFLVSRNLPVKNFFLKDCDTQSETKHQNNAYILSIPLYKSAKSINKGIENALVLDNIDLKEYYKAKTEIGDYGEQKSIETFDKMRFCQAICEMGDDDLKEVFIHLKEIIEIIVNLYNET